MIEFLSSISIFGWCLLALAAATIWQLPAILRMIAFRSREGRWPTPEDENPDSGPGD